MALFGEKYGDKVRMVEVGEFSRELCGGTHVRTTGEIGLFKIASESSAQSGVRRIEAITGEVAYEHELDEAKKIREIAELLKSGVRDVVPAVERLLGSLKEEKQKRQQAELRSLAPAEAQATVDVNGVALWRQNLGEIDPKNAARIVDEAAANQPQQVTLAVVVVGDKLQFIVKAGPEAVAKGAHAGNLLREVAKIAGGGGGGKPDFATAGGKDVSKADEALAAAEGVLATMVK
jgi:alanyl-tRNA synthetase